MDAIMTSHVVNSKIDDSMLPATLSEKSINKLLREFMDYDGVVFSDDMARCLTTLYVLEIILVN